VEHFISPVVKLNQRIKNTAGLIITYITVNLAWLFFRAENWNQVEILIGSIFRPQTEGFNSLIAVLSNSGYLTPSGRMLLFIFPFFILIELFMGKNDFTILLNTSSKYLRWGFYYVILLAILFFGVLDSAPEFIYFQF
jgi:hypothetical protein